MEQEIINKFLTARLLNTEEDYDFFLEIMDKKLFTDGFIYPLNVYLHGFDDATFGDSFIYSLIEQIFHALKDKPFNKKEYELIGVFVKHFELFVPHATLWYGNITNWLLYHYTENPCEEFKKNIASLSDIQKESLGKILKNCNKDSFSYDDNGRVESEFDEIIGACFGRL